MVLVAEAKAVVRTMLMAQWISPVDGGRRGVSKMLDLGRLLFRERGYSCPCSWLLKVYAEPSETYLIALTKDHRLAAFAFDVW